MKSCNQYHNIPPVFDSRSKILILGTFPSVKSREENFFYGHPQNRFWRVISNLLGCELPRSVEEKKAMLLNNNIALWDVIKNCNIKGSSDVSIKDAEANDLSKILETCNIRAIYANGKKAEKLYNQLIFPYNNREITVLPSTSPANASYSLEKLINEWKIILDNN